jgi:hypothetical protein
MIGSKILFKVHRISTILFPRGLNPNAIKDFLQLEWKKERFAQNKPP